MPEKKTNAGYAKDAGYLCGACAFMLGGEWPEEHVATCHANTCGICGKAKSLTAWDDWNWPSDAEEDKIANTTREF